MNLDQVQAFLVLSEELHFGRTADRMYRSQPQVSRLITALEVEVGGALFERTSRRVRLTPLGSEFERRLRPAYVEMVAAFDSAGTIARSITGSLRIGTPPTVDSPILLDIIDDFSRSHPQCETSLVETDVWDPYTPLRQGEIELLCSWLVVDESDLQIGPVIEHRERFLAVGAKHRFANRQSVSLEDLADECVNRVPSQFPRALAEAIQPSRTPSGRAIPRSSHQIKAAPEIVAQIALGKLVSPTVSSHTRYSAHPDIVLVPIRDMPPLRLGIIWCAGRENATVLAFAKIAQANEMHRLQPHRPPGSLISRTTTL